MSGVVSDRFCEETIEDVQTLKYSGTSTTSAIASEHLQSPVTVIPVSLVTVTNDILASI